MSHVSVIIPTYNRKAYVQETIDSVLAQTYTDYEIIVIDDGSTDGTGETLKARYGNRIHYVWQENQGESSARNHGIEIARGEYIALLDSDDLWLPQKLSKQVTLLDANPEIVLVFTSSWQMDAKGQRLAGPLLCSNVREDDLTLEALCLNNKMGNAGSTAMVRREPLERMGGFDPTLQYGEDWDFWLRLRRQGSFASINEPLASIRQHRGSQWHNPRPETVDQRLADHQRMLEKAFTDWSGDVPDRLRERALARAYSMAALLDYFIGRTVLGQQRLREAIRLDPDYQSELQHFQLQLKHKFLDPSLATHKSIQTIISSAIETFEQWPSEFPLSEGGITQILKEICTYYLFESYKMQDFSATRYCLFHAIRYDSSLLYNRGIWSISLETILGSTVTNWLRRGMKYNPGS